MLFVDLYKAFHFRRSILFNSVIDVKNSFVSANPLAAAVFEYKEALVR